jgi:hypothetical protein
MASTADGRWTDDGGFYRGVERVFIYEIGLAGARILQIEDERGMLEFNARYNPARPSHDPFGRGRSAPEWDALFEEYDGIEIAPYQWHFRLAPDFFWYYGWDCASGCVWRASKLQLCLIGEYRPPAAEK